MTDATRPGLLVSVRSADEAAAALAGGADLIDVKEPDRGALGRADDATIAAVVRTVAGRVPVSAAMGELSEAGSRTLPPGVAFAKWGLAGWSHRITELPVLVSSLCQSSGNGCRSVLVAYADHARARAPQPGAICRLACQWHMTSFVIDTFLKDGTTLLDWLAPGELAALGEACRTHGVRTIFAGSLGVAQITQLRRFQLDWIAVRGAACSGGRRGAIDVQRVRTLKETIIREDSVSQLSTRSHALRGNARSATLRVAEPPVM